MRSEANDTRIGRCAEARRVERTRRGDDVEVLARERVERGLEELPVVLELGGTSDEHERTLAGGLVGARSARGLPDPWPNQPHVLGPSTVAVLERLRRVREHAMGARREPIDGAERREAQALTQGIEPAQVLARHEASELPEQRIAPAREDSLGGCQAQPERRAPRKLDRQEVGREDRKREAARLDRRARAPAVEVHERHVGPRGGEAGLHIGDLVLGAREPDAERPVERCRRRRSLVVVEHERLDRRIHRARVEPRALHPGHVSRERADMHTMPARAQLEQGGNDREEVPARRRGVRKDAGHGSTSRASSPTHIRVNRADTKSTFESI